MKTVFEVKQALNPDLYVDYVRELQQAQRQQVSKKKSSPRRNKWGELFPLCKSGK